MSRRTSTLLLACSLSAGALGLAAGIALDLPEGRWTRPLVALVGLILLGVPSIVFARPHLRDAPSLFSRACGEAPLLTATALGTPLLLSVAWQGITDAVAGPWWALLLVFAVWMVVLGIFTAAVVRAWRGGMPEKRAAFAAAGAVAVLLVTPHLLGMPRLMWLSLALMQLTCYYALLRRDADGRTLAWGLGASMTAVVAIAGLLLVLDDDARLGVLSLGAGEFLILGLGGAALAVILIPLAAARRPVAAAPDASS